MSCEECDAVSYLFVGGAGRETCTVGSTLQCSVVGHKTRAAIYLTV